MKQLSLSFPISVIALLLSTACGPRESPVETGKETQSLHLAHTEPENLDPHTVSGLPEIHVINALLEGLVAMDPRDLSPVPAAAERWEVSEEGRRYTFYLRPEARWSNGEPVTARDFYLSYQRILSPGLGSRYAYMHYGVVNAEAFHQGELEDFSAVGFEVIDDHTLSILLDHPLPYFLSLLHHPSWFPVHPATVRAFGDIDQPGNPWTRPGRFVGNGPFSLEQWRPNQVLTVRANPQYWDAANVRLSEIHFHPFENAQTEERAFRAGQLHVTQTVPPERIPAYRRDNPEILRSDPYYGTYFYRFNVTRPPLDQAEVRRALSLAIDRRGITENLLRGGQAPAYSFTPPGNEDYPVTARLAEDVEEARSLLADAGYAGGEGFPRLTLLYNTSEQHRSIAEAVQQMWKRHLNIDVELHNQEWKIFLENQTHLDYDISRSSWIGDYLDPNSFLDLMLTEGGNNRTGWSHSGYDEQIANANRLPDPTMRMAGLQQAEDLLMEESPVAPIYFYRSLYLAHPSVRGWTPNTLGYRFYKNIYLE